MRRIEKRVNKHNHLFHVISERFDSFTEFSSVCDSRDVVWKEYAGPVRELTHDPDKNCDTFEEACDYLLYGYTEKLNEFKSRVGELQKYGTRLKTVHYSDVLGYAPIVPNALLGLPNSMMNSRKVAHKKKAITLVCDPAVSGTVEPYQVFEWGCKLVNAIMNVERSGVRVRVDYLKMNTADDELYMLRMPIKDEFNPVNIKRLMFPLTHIAMQRYLAWDWLERLPNSTPLSGYGCSTSVVGDTEKDVIRDALDDNEYLAYYGMDVDGLLKQIDL